MKLQKISNSILLAAAVASLWGNACSKKVAANQVLVAVSPAGGTLVVAQTVTFTAIVTGATDVSATFDCTFTTTPDPTTAVPSPKATTPAPCVSAVGALSNVQNTSTTVASTVTFTGPPAFPPPATYPNLAIIITATSKADTKKTGKATIGLDSGIRLQMTPTTATLATGETKQFLAKDFNGIVLSNDVLKWDVTADATATAASKTCTPGCGSVSAPSGPLGATYTAPATVPTQATATIFATSTVDISRRAQASITIVKAGDITFSGISPSVTAQGALQQDIFLAATNATSQIGVTIDPTDSICTPVPSNPNNAIGPSQIKVIFAAGAASSSSIGARIRLSSKQLSTAGFLQIHVSSSNPSIKVITNPPNASFCLAVNPVRPTIVSTSPDGFQESTLGSTSGTPLVIDGGYFGDPSSPTIAANFDGQNFNTVTSSGSLTASARRFVGFVPRPPGVTHLAGLFPLGVQYRINPIPSPGLTATTAFTNVAVIPDYGSSNPGTTLSTVTFAPSSAPSSIAVDPVLGYAVVALAGLNTPGASPTTNTASNVEFLNLAGGTPAPAGTFSSQGFLATGVAVDDQLHVAAVVNYASRTLSILSIPSGTLLGTADLHCVIPQSDPACVVVTEPFPFSVGIDPHSHRALVAFASTNVGVIVNMDPSLIVNPPSPAVSPCLPIAPIQTYCPLAYVTLATGPSPHVAFEDGARLAYVTPGGTGLLSAVDLGNPSTGSVDIVSATRASNVVTITTATAHNLSPGNPGTVLVSGLPTGKTNNTDFNGSFSVGAVLDSTHFQFAQATKDDTATCAAICKASSGVPFLTYSISPAITGVAINPLTRRVVLADPNTIFGQISFIDTQSQSVSSMTLFAGATGQVSTGSPELGATNVAFQPFTNTAISFNPKVTPNEISLLDPSALQRLQIIPTAGIAAAAPSFTPPGSTTAITVNLSGALAVDSANNLALAVNSGSSSVSVLTLGTIKTVHIERVVTPGIDPTGVATPANLTSAVKITLGAAPAAIGPVKIFGSGFGSTPVQVRLDGSNVALQGATVTPVGTRELDVTFPAGFFTGPRHYALDVVTSAPAGLNISNVADFTVLEEIPLPACSGTAAAPGGVAIDEVHNLALVTNTGCHQVSVISLDPASNFGTITKAIQTGGTPTGVAVLPRLAITGQTGGKSGVAVVTNNSANTVTIIDLANLATITGVTDVAVGIAPSGVAINQETNLAVIANTNSNTVSTLDLTPLTASPIGALAPKTVAVDQNPIAVAIDPDRGTNGRGLAAVTCLLLNGASTPIGVIDGVDIGGTTPVKLSSASAFGLQSTPTGIVFDPAVSPALFYAVSTQGNQITAFNPDTNATSSIKVGINPTAIAYNFQTGTMLTVNALSNSISIVDSQTFRTKATLGIGATSRFSAAIHTLTNLAVIADQANNRVLLFPLPK